MRQTKKDKLLKYIDAEIDLVKSFILDRAGDIDPAWFSSDTSDYPIDYDWWSDEERENQQFDIGRLTTLIEIKNILES